MKYAIIDCEYLIEYMFMWYNDDELTWKYNFAGEYETESVMDLINYINNNYKCHWMGISFLRKEITFRQARE